MAEIKELYLNVTEYLSANGSISKILGALLVLIVGWFTIKFLINLLDKILTKKQFDITLKPFLLTGLTWLIRIALLISVAGIIGIETTSFIAILGAVGFAIGMAMQGALGNLAGGVLILFFRPYKVGDAIEAQGSIGTVKEIQLFTTILLNAENKTIIIPNGAISNDKIINYTVQGLIRVDCPIGVSYSTDITKAKEVLLQVIKNDPDVLDTPPAFVGITSFGDSSINLTVRGYTTPDKKWDVFFRVNEAIKIALDSAEIEIPFPQMDVNLKK